MKNWKGIWIIVVAVLHMVYALASFAEEYQQMLVAGVWASVDNLETGIAAWFFLFGILMFTVGFMIQSFEKKSLAVPTSAANTLLLVTILGAALMPVSGFWLMLPPVLAMFRR